MRILLDTHTWLWMLGAPERLGVALPLLEDPANRLTLSSASTWEIAIKVSVGKLALPEDVETYLPRLMDRDAIDRLPVDHRHALRVAGLPFHHRDPFDRMLVAQSMVEGLPIATADRAFDPYRCDVIRVGRAS